MEVPNPMPRPPMEIAGRLSLLEAKKVEFMGLDCIGAALAIGSQIEMLKWAYHMQPKRDNLKEEDEEKKDGKV